MKVIIVGGGTPPSKELILREMTKNTSIIAADSGVDCLYKYKIVPKLIIGDLDSANKKALDFFQKKNVPNERYPHEKDSTDSELALKKALGLKAREIIFLGLIGGKRTDHFLGVLGLLKTCLRLNIKACLKDDHQNIIMLNKSATIGGRPGEMFSLLAYGGTIKRLTISGAKYPLQNYNLKMGDGLTLSNQFQNRNVKIKFVTEKNSNLILVTIPN